MDDRPINVLLVTTSFPLNEASSSGIFIKRFIENLPSSVHVTVLTPDASENFESNIDVNVNYQILTCRYAPKKYQLLSHQAGGIPAALKYHPWLYCLVPMLIFSLFLNCLLQARKVDVIHANWTINGMIAGLAGIIWGKPVITTTRGEDISRAEKTKLDKWILIACLKLNKLIVCVSHSIKQRLEIITSNNINKLIVIPNGVDISYPTTELKINSNKDRDTIQLITVGSLISRKSIDTIVKAVGFNDKYELTIIGEGPEKVLLEKLAAKEKVTERVKFCGAISPENVQAELAKADIFIIASLSEGRPNALLEAMAIGLPVIASNIDSHCEILNHKKNGLLFEKSDAKDLSKQLETIINNPELAVTLSKSARQYITNAGLTWENCASEYASIYRQLIY